MNTALIGNIFAIFFLFSYFPLCAGVCGCTFFLGQRTLCGCSSSAHFLPFLLFIHLLNYSLEESRQRCARMREQGISSRFKEDKPEKLIFVIAFILSHTITLVGLIFDLR